MRQLERWGPAILLCAGALISSGPPAAAEPAPREGKDQATPQGPLVALPSRQGAHIGKIKALGDNAWLELGRPAADPKWGRARGRSWCTLMPLAPELRGAFLYGEGVHGYTKPDGRYMDDLWLYDVNAHRWVCCYPGADTRALDLVLDRDGFEATRAGDRLPVAQQVHAYAMNTYDTARRRLLSMPCTHSYWEAALPQRKSWLRPPPADAGPWEFDTATAKWDRHRTGTAAPRSGYGDTFVYLPDRRQAFFAHANQEVWLYDTRKDRWRQVKPGGPPPPFGIDATSCYDPKRQRVYVGGGAYPVAPAEGHAFWCYDLKADRWIDLKPKGKPVKGHNGYSTLNALMVYDAAAERVLLIYHSTHYSKPERMGVYVYDPENNAWDETPRPLPEKLSGRQVKNGFFDPELNAVFLHSAGDSQDDGVIWVYRYRKHR